MNLEYLWKHDPRKFTQCVERLTERVMETIRPEKRESLRKFHAQLSEILSSCKNDAVVRKKIMELLEGNMTAQLGALSQLHAIMLQTGSGTPNGNSGPQKNNK